MQHRSEISRSRRLAGVLAALALTAGLLAAAAPAYAARCAVPDLAQYRDLVRPLPAEQMVPTRGDGLTPPEDPNVGDSWLWYTWRLAGYPEPELKMCTVRGEGEHCYVVVEDSQWGTRVNQEDIDAILEAWENSSPGQWPDQGIHELNTYNFGPIPDALDNDPKVYILYYDFDVNADGFFWYFDQYPDGTQPFASNECEVLYMNSSDNDPGGEYLISVQAHELEHMIHWLADDNESTWLNEGLAELAMWLYGHPDPIISFPGNPDINLTTWQSGFADYVKVYLWTLYLYEHFGGQPIIREVIAQLTNSTFSVEQALQNLGYLTTFSELTADWTTANFLDDPGLAGGRYDYAGADLPAFAAVTKSTYPVPPTNATVNHYAADYIRFTNGQPVRLRFDGADAAVWTARVVGYSGGLPTWAQDFVLDGADVGTVDVPGFGTEYDELIFVVAKVTASGATSYQYSTEPIPTSVEEGAIARMHLETGQNPFSGSAVLRLALAAPAHVEAAVFDARGTRVRGLFSGDLPAGAHALAWDGLDASGRVAPAGVYFVRAATDDGSSADARLVRTR